MPSRTFASWRTTVGPSSRRRSPPRRKSRTGWSRRSIRWRLSREARTRHRSGQGVDCGGFELGGGSDHDKARLPEEQGCAAHAGGQGQGKDRGPGQDHDETHGNPCQRGQPAHGAGAGRDGQEGDLRFGGEIGNAEAAAWNPSSTGLRTGAPHGEDEIFYDAFDDEYHDALEFPDLGGNHETEPKAFQAYPTEVFEDEEAESYLFCDGDHVRREVYAAKGGLADAMEKLGYKARRFDFPEWKFELLSHRRRLWQLYIEEAPDIVWIAPPCTLWSPLQTWNKDLGALEVLWTRRSYDHRTNLSMTRRLYRGQMKRKKIGVVEHPWTSSAWKTPAFKGLGGHNVDLDQCAFGSTLPNDEGIDTPIQKRTCLKVTYEELVPLLHRKCPGGHVHQHVVGSLPAGGGSRAKAAGAYQPGFCAEIAEALDNVFHEGECITSEIREVVDHVLLEHEADQDNTNDAEEAARMALSRNDFSFTTLAKIANRIDAAKHRHRRHKKDGKLADNEFAFIGGLWQFGGKHGITKGTILYPNVCRYLNGFFRELDIVDGPLSIWARTSRQPSTPIITTCAAPRASRSPSETFLEEDCGSAKETTRSFKEKKFGRWTGQGRDFPAHTSRPRRPLSFLMPVSHIVRAMEWNAMVPDYVYWAQPCQCVQVFEGVPPELWLSSCTRKNDRRGRLEDATTEAQYEANFVEERQTSWSLGYVVDFGGKLDGHNRVRRKPEDHCPL